MDKKMLKLIFVLNVLFGGALWIGGLVAIVTINGPEPSEEASLLFTSWLVFGLVLCIFLAYKTDRFLEKLYKTKRAKYIVNELKKYYVYCEFDSVLTDKMRWEVPVLIDRLTERYCERDYLMATAHLDNMKEVTTPL